MSLLDLLNLKLKKEKEFIKVNYPNIPLSIFDSKFMNTFKDENLRHKIYESYQYSGLQDIIDCHKALMSLAAKDYKLAIYCINDSILLDKNNIKFLNLFGKEIVEYNLSFYQLYPYKEKLIKLKDKLTKEEFSEVCKNPENYVNLFIREDVNVLNKEFVFGCPKEAEFLLMNPNQPYIKELIYLANNVPYEKYIELKEKIILLNNKGFKDVNPSELIAFWKYYDYDITLLEDIISLETNNLYVNGFSNNLVSSNLKLSEIAKRFINFKISHAINEKEHINNVRNLLIEKYSGYSMFEITKILNVLQTSNINLSPQLIDMIALIENIMKIEDIEEMKKMMDVSSSLSPKEFQNQLGNLKINEKKYTSVLYNPSNDKSNRKEINYNGTQITYIESDVVDFNILVHRIKHDRKDDKVGMLATTDRTNEIIENPSLFVEENSIGSDILSTSLIFPTNMKMFGSNSDDIVLGFSNLDNGYIIGTSCIDHGSNMEGEGKDYTQAKKLIDVISPEGLQQHSVMNESNYNEVSISRLENGKKKRPDFILVTKNFHYRYNVNLTENTMKWAKEYNIPIVEVDGNKVYKHACNKIQEILDSFNQNKIIGDQSLYELFCMLRSIQMTPHPLVCDPNKIIEIFTNENNNLEQINQSIRILENALKINTLNLDHNLINEKLNNLKKHELNIVNSNLEENPDNMSLGFANILLIMIIIIITCLIISVVTFLAIK